MFRAAEATDLIEEDEYLQWIQLDDTVTVYRGLTSHNAENIKELSWSLDYDKANGLPIDSARTEMCTSGRSETE